MNVSGVAYERAKVVGEMAEVGIVQFGEFAHKQQFKHWLGIIQRRIRGGEAAERCMAGG